MKLTFFLIALFLILARICFPMSGLWHNGNNDGNMVMKGDHIYEEIKWSGKIKLSDDEKSLAEITPGGYLKFRLNDTTLKAESNLQGEISYTLFDGQDHLALSDSGKRFIAVQIRRMIAFGYFSDGRAEHIYKKGGDRALLAELAHIKMGGSREDYFNLLFKSDSLTRDEWIELLDQIDSTGDDNERAGYLKRFTPERLRDSVTGFRWLTSVGRMEQDELKKELLLRYIGQDTADSAGLLPDRFDSVLSVTRHFESDDEKGDVYKKLIDIPGKTDEEWIGLIRAAAGIMDRDDIKSGLLQQIASKMPKKENVRSEFVTAAKSIRDDMEYGQTMRKVE